MAKLRHGAPVDLSGWMDKEGKAERRFPRYLRLCDIVLSNSHDDTRPPSWKVSLRRCPMGPGPRPREFVIQLPMRNVSYFARTDAQFEAWREALSTANHRFVENYYRLGDILGEGAFAKVFIGEDKHTSEMFAVKEIDKKSYEPRDHEFTIREVNIMMKVTHPNIVNTHDIFENLNHLHLVIEYMQGGELFDIIADQGHLSEQRASQVLRDIIIAVDYLHNRGVVHCDIKPENILCKTKQWPLRVKLCDFGLANVVDQSVAQVSDANESMTATTGTPGYVAPEVILKKNYGPPVDMWACGVVLYIMLSGRMPFYGRSDVECLRRTANGQYSFPEREWHKISDDAKSLVRGLLQIDPDKRLTARAALQHRWLAVPEQLSTSPVGNDLSGIHSRRRKFRKITHAVVLVQRMRDLGNAAIAAASANGTAPRTSSSAGSNVRVGASTDTVSLGAGSSAEAMNTPPQIHDAVGVSTASESVTQNA